ncbi:Uncharacterized protein FKW44_009630, partial [Caligus rogercresseyi]
VMISSLIVLCIFVNILVIIGGSGGRWRRSLLLPWLIVYGFIIMGAIAAHQWFTTLCWVEEKIYGLVCLITGFVGLWQLKPLRNQNSSLLEIHLGSKDFKKKAFRPFNTNFYTFL